MACQAPLFMGSGFWMPGTQERRLSQKYYKVPAIKHCKRRGSDKE